MVVSLLVMAQLMALVLTGVGVGAGTGSTSYLDLLYSSIATYFWRLLVVEAATSDGSADSSLANHFAIHVLIGTLVRVPQLLIYVAVVMALASHLRLRTDRGAVGMVRSSNISVGLGHR